MRICLFEQRPETLEPLSLTRPIFDLVCGMMTLGDKQRRYFGLGEGGALLRHELQNLYRLQHPGVPVNDVDWLQRDGLVLVNGRWLPPDGKAPPAFQSCIASAGGQIAYLVLSGQQTRHLTAHNLPLMLEEWRNALPEKSVGGVVIDYPWDLVEHNGAALIQDFVADYRGQDTARLNLVGPLDRLWVDASARIDPFVVADTTAGPVYIAGQTVIAPFTRLEGPCYIGPGTHVLGAKVRAGTTIGPYCRIGGEIEASIIHGYSNKYHEGFLGHSYLGEWVNLGAGTHNSDLRNDYGEVSVTIAGQRIATGQSKIGCFLGDHTKTGLGTLLNTGTNVGVFCQLLPDGRLAPKHVPSFMNWWNGQLQEGAPVEKLLQTARQVMKRRGAFLTSEHVVLYRHLLEDTALERQRVLADAPLAKQKRKSA